MTVLAPMRPETFEAFLQAAIASYAEDNVAAGRWKSPGALERSRADFKRLLPAGLATPDHYLFEIKLTDGTTIGSVWFAIEERQGARSAFVYNIEIEEKSRRQGHATRAFRELESVATKLGATSIGLHVFGFNRPAQALYSSLGYNVTGLNMMKRLDTFHH